MSYPKGPKGYRAETWRNTVDSLREVAADELTNDVDFDPEEAEHVLAALAAYDPDAAVAPAATKPDPIAKLRSAVANGFGVGFMRDDAKALLAEIDAATGETGEIRESFTDGDGDKFVVEFADSFDFVNVVQSPRHDDDPDAATQLTLRMHDAPKLADKIRSVYGRAMKRRGLS